MGGWVSIRQERWKGGVGGWGVGIPAVALTMMNRKYKDVHSSPEDTGHNIRHHENSIQYSQDSDTNRNL